MWTTVGLSPQDRSDFRSAATDLLQATSRTLILAIGGIYLAFVIATGFWPEQLGVNVWSVVPVILITCLAAYKLLDTHFVLAQLVLIAGLAVAVFVGLWVSGYEGVLLFLALLPLLAAVTLGLLPALIVEVGVVGLVLMVTRVPGIPDIPVSTTLYTVLGGAITAVLGWAATHALLTVTGWALYAFGQARERMDEAREHRVELTQVQQDLLEANRELARVTDRLRAMYEVAEEARRTKEAFVANVSHELRTPLNMIIGFSDMITQSPQVYSRDLPPALLSDIATINENSQHLARLIDDVLDLSQVEAGSMALSKEWVDLGEIVEAAALAVRPLFESKKLYLRLHIAEDLPQVFCDSTRIREVILNLLSNAGRYTDTGGVTMRVEHTFQEVVVSVADTGPGISPVDQARLFQPFHQLDGPLRRRGGTGLGLSISKRFVEMHDGEMWLESEVGAGSKFSFKLPLRAPARVAAAQADNASRWFNPYESPGYRERLRRSKAPAPQVEPRLVLVEQEAVLERLFNRYMSDFETTRVESLDAAVAELERTPARALILNAPPTVDDSVEPQLTDLPYGTPAIRVWMPSESEATRELGLRHYLLKPITRDKLLSVLDELARREERAIETVLLVDDEPDALRLFARMLTSGDRTYRVLRARDGARALSLMRQRQPDVVLLDLIMPGIDGFQVLQQKAHDPAIRDIPVIVVSSRDPSGEPIVSDRLTVTRNGGLSARHLLACIRAVSTILSTSGSIADSRSEALLPGEAEGGPATVSRFPVQPSEAQPSEAQPSEAQRSLPADPELLVDPGV
jgi:signal transduction histidine kinase/CheY-like chemotaxis protein